MLAGLLLRAQVAVVVTVVILHPSIQAVVVVQVGMLVTGVAVEILQARPLQAVVAAVVAEGDQQMSAHTALVAAVVLGFLVKGPVAPPRR